MEHAKEPGFYWSVGDPITPEMRVIYGDAFCDHLASLEADLVEDSLFVSRPGPPGQRTFLQFVDRPNTPPPKEGLP